MVGHPWSFGNTKNLALFTEAQMRFNTEKLLCLIKVGLVLDWLEYETMVYLANSWTRQGNGFFTVSTPENPAIAFDLAISQIFLPGAADVIQRIDNLREKCPGYCSANFRTPPRS